MFSWRITKYNPLFRDERGNYTVNEWTSISDIFKILPNSELAIKEYLVFEELYINAIIHEKFEY